MGVVMIGTVATTHGYRTGSRSMNTRTVHLAAFAGKLLSAILAIVATAVFCYFLLHPASTPSGPAPTPLGPAITTPAPAGSPPAAH